MRRARSALLALLVLTAACGDDGGDAVDSTPYVELDGSPRPPDEVGVLVEVADDFSALTLDGGRTYEVADDLQCFATQDGSTVPLRQRVGEFVHLGIEGDTVVWLASIADVIDGPDADVVYYVGDVVDLVDGALVFDDGTVLRVADGYGLPDPPEDGARIRVTIDPEQRAVVAVEPAV